MNKLVLQKFIAESGLCSRRKAEELIRAGKVMVNNKPAELGMKVGENDEVLVYGKKITLANEKIYIILNKPKGYTCTSRKFEGEKNVFEIVKNLPTSPQPSSYKGEGERERLFVVGRLDKESRGLVLLTNDGDLTQKITHPRYEHEKEYVVTIKDFQLKITNDEILKKINNGIDIGEGDGVVMVKQIKLLNFDKKNYLIKYSIILTEGKKRQIRRMFKALDCHILDLVRVRIGAINLGGLKEGSWRYLTSEEINNLLK
jgi:pseudouridine synthase